MMVQPQPSDPVHTTDMDPVDGVEARTASWRTSPLVLVVDDDQHSREGVSEYLVQHGFRVMEAADGAEALRKIAWRQPHAVLLDLAIPRTDGWAVAEQLRRDPKCSNVAVVAWSAFDYPEQRRRAFDAGCDAFVQKPCDLDTLVPTILEVIERKR
ncbi:MAG: response regulator [Acidobacteria bacterium]|nr:response regulator [Acidobacteriota bacterium]